LIGKALPDGSSILPSSTKRRSSFTDGRFLIAKKNWTEGMVRGDAPPYTLRGNLSAAKTRGVETPMESEAMWNPSQLHRRAELGCLDSKLKLSFSRGQHCIAQWGDSPAQRGHISEIISV